MKSYWFDIVEQDTLVPDGPMPVKPKTYRVVTLLMGVLIGVIGSYFLIPPKVADPVVMTITNPISTPSPSIKNPMLNPSYEDDYDEEEEDD